MYPPSDLRTYSSQIQNISFSEKLISHEKEKEQRKPYHLIDDSAVNDLSFTTDQEKVDPRKLEKALFDVKTTYNNPDPLKFQSRIFPSIVIPSFVNERSRYDLELEHKEERNSRNKRIAHPETEVRDNEKFRPNAITDYQSVNAVISYPQNTSPRIEKGNVLRGEDPRYIIYRYHNIPCVTKFHDRWIVYEPVPLKKLGCDLRVTVLRRWLGCVQLCFLALSEGVRRDRRVFSIIRSSHHKWLTNSLFQEWCFRYKRNREIKSRIGFFELQLMITCWKKMKDFVHMSKKCKAVFHSFFRRQVYHFFRSWARLCNNLTKIDKLILNTLVDKKKWAFELILTESKKNKRVKERSKQYLLIMVNLLRKVFIAWKDYTTLNRIRRIAIFSRTIPIRRKVFIAWKDFIFKEQPAPPLLIPKGANADIIYDLLSKPGRIKNVVIEGVDMTLTKASTNSSTLKNVGEAFGGNELNSEDRLENLQVVRSTKIEESSSKNYLLNTTEHELSTMTFNFHVYSTPMYSSQIVNVNSVDNAVHNPSIKERNGKEFDEAIRKIVMNELQGLINFDIMEVLFTLFSTSQDYIQDNCDVLYSSYYSSYSKEQNVIRCCKLIKWFQTYTFFENQGDELLSSNIIDHKDYFRTYYIHIKNSIIAALAIHYYYITTSTKGRKDYISYLTATILSNRHLKKICQKYFMEAIYSDFEGTLYRCIQLVSNRFTYTDKRIRMNEILREILLVSTVSTFNRYPLYITSLSSENETENESNSSSKESGDKQTSENRNKLKRTALNLIGQNCLGILSPNEFWRKFPAIYLFQYQCTATTTSSSLKNQYDLAVSVQKESIEKNTQYKEDYEGNDSKEMEVDPIQFRYEDDVIVLQLNDIQNLKNNSNGRIRKGPKEMLEDILSGKTDFKQNSKTDEEEKEEGSRKEENQNGNDRIRPISTLIAILCLESV